ncbi:hypothetical protein CTI12_AA556230 [Artemisia annua]|uniref:Uncharacterized protein n=1 Tax=Artemisia annua TaxID=35608 RepID=A0A2U1KWN5_ARTAN|nr:hypothetical protein CTI12_AA556230 [Artemisia annua]
MQAIIDADEVLKARVAELYTDKTLTNDDRVQRLADLINTRSEEVELADLINPRSEEVALNELIQPIKQAQSQKRKRNPTRAQRISEMKKSYRSQFFAFSDWGDLIEIFLTRHINLTLQTIKISRPIGYGKSQGLDDSYVMDKTYGPNELKLTEFNQLLGLLTPCYYLSNATIKKIMTSKIW